MYDVCIIGSGAGGSPIAYELANAGYSVVVLEKGEYHRMKPKDFELLSSYEEDPKTSVLDKNCKAHDLENLYVTDASFMPTGGSVPYTWTIYANSFRVADVIKERLHFDD